MKPFALRSLALTLLASWAGAQDIALDSEMARWRATGEVFSSDIDRLGLFGLHLDLMEPFRTFPDIFLGVGGYGAVTGSRGGLFVGGLTAGWRKEVYEDWNLELGIFGGGGGGGGNPEFSGLLLRPYVAVERQLGLVGLRLEAARVDQPDGDLEDTHIAFGITLPAEILEARESSRSRHIPGRAIARRTLRARALAARFDAGEGSTRRTGGPQSDYEVVGFGIDYFLTPQLFFPLEVHGAVGGESDGFAMGMAGIGGAMPLGTDRVRLELKGLLGAGGGGDVGTGGGWGWRGTAGLEFLLNHSWALAIEAGYMDYPDGDFDAETLGVSLARRVTSPELSLEYPRSRLLREGLDSQDVEIDQTRVAVEHKIYSPDGDAVKKDGSAYSNAISLIGVGIEEPLTRWFALTGRAFGAWGGNIGGYAEGLFGGKFELRPVDDWRHVFSLTGEVGAAGGGGIDVGSGLIYQVGAGYRFEWTDRLSIGLNFGKMEANEGSFNAEAYTVSVLWNLNRARYR